LEISEIFARQWINEMHNPFQYFFIYIFLLLFY
jgi:hypothetical protein